MLVAGSAHADWRRANFHAHAKSGPLTDDGSETPETLHRAFAARGFAFSVHSVHSSYNQGPDAGQRFAQQRAEEESLAIEGLTPLLGEELTVAAGKHFKHSTRLLGKRAPGNLNHVTVVGAGQLIP